MCRVFVMLALDVGVVRGMLLRYDGGHSHGQFVGYATCNLALSLRRRFGTRPWFT